MPRWLVIDELIICIRVKQDAPSQGICRTLGSEAFRRRLQKAVKSCTDRNPSLKGVRVTVNR